MLCPECKEEVNKRVDGCCPNCWTRVEYFKGKDGTRLLYRTDDDRPPTQLMKYWLKLVSERLTSETGRDVNFDIPKRQLQKYQKEIALAEQLLSIADWDMEVAKVALELAVRNAYRAPSTLTWTIDEFPLQVAVARATIEETTKKTSEDFTKEQLAGRQNVWE